MSSIQIFNLLSLALLALALGTAPLAAEKPTVVPPAAEPTSSLSPFEVRADSVEFHKWLKVESPNYILYTDTDKKEAARVIRQLEMLHQATQFFLKRRCTKQPPLIVVLPTNRSDWKKISSKGSVQWEVATSLVGSVHPLLLAQYDWQQDGISSVWSMVGMHDVRAMNLAGPLWFNRGISHFFRSVEFSGDSLTLGKQGFDAYFITKLGWMKWPQFFGITSSSDEFTKDTDHHTRYEAQCGVFAHYVFTHSDQNWTQRYLAWASYLEHGNEVTEPKFKEIMGCDWAALEKAITDLHHGGKYTSGTIQFPPAALQFTVVSSNPSTKEMRELFVLSQILNQKTEDSKKSLNILLSRGLKTETLRALLASACDRHDNKSAGLAELRTIAAAGSDNPLAYSELAYYLFQQSVPELTIDARVNADALDEIRSMCRRSLELEPLTIEANETLAWTEALAPEIGKANLDTISSLCRALGSNAQTDSALTALAVARWRTGNTQQAVALANRLLNSPFTRPSCRKLAQQLQAKVATDQPAVPREAPAKVATPGSAQ